MTAEILGFPKPGETTPRDHLNRVGGRPTDQAQGRTRSYLTQEEIDSLIRAAGSVGRHRHRDKTLILIAYRHGLRVSECVGLKWSDVDFKAAQTHIRRLKNGVDSTHPLQGDEIRALRRLKRDYGGAFVFTTERGGPLIRNTFNKIIARAGQRAGIPFPVTPHQLRHACGFALANRGVPTRTLQHWLGHSSIRHTVRYTALSSAAFEGIWR